MIFLGVFNPGDSVFYAGNFHNDIGTLETPTGPEAQLRTPAGVWSNLTAPGVQNSKTGQMGGMIDTTGFSSGMYAVRMAGDVTTGKTKAFEYLFIIGFLRPGDQVFVAQNYHNDAGTLEDPTSPEAQLRTPAGVWSNLAAPAKQNAKTGHYGVVIDTTGYAPGQYTARLAGTVTTGKLIAADTSFYLENIAASTTPVRRQILTALAARLASITTANGYRTNIGNDVHEWQVLPLDPNESTLRIEYRDEAGSTEWYAVGLHLHTLPVTMRILCRNNTAGSALSTVRDALADVYQALHADLTFGGLAEDTIEQSEAKEDYSEAADRASSAEVTYSVLYTTAPGTP